MILKNITEKLKTVVSLLLRSITDRAILFNIMLPNGACFWRLPISAFFQERYERPKCPICLSTSYNCGIALVIILAVHCFSFLRGKRGKYFGKDKKNYPFEYLFTIDLGHPEVIYWIPNILKFLRNISVHIYWLLMTAIMQLSLTIVFCGMLLTILLSNRVPDYMVQTTRMECRK